MIKNSLSNKMKKYYEEVAATSSYIELSNSLDNKFIAIKDSADIAFDRITMLESRVSVIEEDLNKKTRQKKIKITIRG